MLRNRLLSAIVLIPLILVPVIIGGPVFFALVVIAFLICGYEFYDMARRAGYRPQFWLGLPLIALLLLDSFAHLGLSSTILMAAVVLSLTVAVFRMGEGWVVGWALTLAGALYVGLLGATALLIRELPEGAIWTTNVLLSVWATDSMAYIAGHRWGRRGFFTRISPKKTWEGAIGGWIAAAISMGVLGWVAGLDPLRALLLGLGIGVVGSIGDLAESVIKRQFGAKDSGQLVPGHGGLLDRVDSLLFATVFSYYYLVWIARI